MPFFSNWSKKMAIHLMTASGNVGGDAELKYTLKGTVIGEFSLPVKAGYGDNKKQHRLNVYYGVK